MLEWLGATEYSKLEWLSFAISVVSLFGIASIWTAMRHLWLIRKRGRAIVRFRRSWFRESPLSIVISTSEDHVPTNNKPEVPTVVSNGSKAGQRSKKPDYPRKTVSVWTTYAVSEISEVASMLGYRKTFETDVAERLTNNQTGDLVLIGGRIKNTRSRQFSERFNATYPDLAIERSHYDLTPVKALSIGGRKFDFMPMKDKNTGHTVSDRAILVLWRNPFIAGKRPRRGILCAGFTSMGTAGAAQYLSDAIRNGSLRKMWKDQRPRGWFYRRFPQFIVVLDVYINNDRYLDVQPVTLLPIPKAETGDGFLEYEAPIRRPLIHNYDATADRKNVTLLWDIDGTLITTAKGKAKSLFSQAVSTVLQREVEPVVSDGEGRPDLEVLNLTFRHAGVEPSSDQLSAAVDQLNRLSPQSLYENERFLLDYAEQALRECANRKIKQAIITGNTRAKAMAKLGAFHLTKYFDVDRSAFGDETHTRAEAVGRAITRNPGATVVCIGDTPNDIQAAQANDVAVIAVATGDFAADELETYGPTQLVTSAAGIVPALERIVSSEAKRAS